MEILKPKTCDVCLCADGYYILPVPLTNIKACYCRTCMFAYAHPWHVLVTITAQHGGLKNSPKDWEEMVSFTCKHLNKTHRSFNLDVQKTIETVRSLKCLKSSPKTAGIAASTMITPVLELNAL